MVNHPDAKTAHVQRAHGRANDLMRPIKVSYGAFGYAAGSVLFEIGNTKVLCSATLQPGVPHFLKGSRTGWLSAEYAMLPTATFSRTQRESVVLKRSGRATEISRLIGRALRPVINLDSIGERTITIDCDVLQADGGTRTASISGAYLALKRAQDQWLQERLLGTPCLIGDVAAVSVGMINGNHLLDLDCNEDNVADVDYNFILTSAGNIIEIQGCVEQKNPITWQDFDSLKDLALKGINDIFSATKTSPLPSNPQRSDRVPLFCLRNRVQEQT